MNDWRRADHGDLPAVGDVITRVIFRADDTSVSIHYRMRVAVVITAAGGFGVYGAGLDLIHQPTFPTPPRPDDMIGRQAILWRYTE